MRIVFDAFILAVVAVLLIGCIVALVTTVASATVYFLTGDASEVHCNPKYDIGWFNLGGDVIRMTAVEYQEFCEK